MLSDLPASPFQRELESYRFLPCRGVEIAKELKEASGPKLKDFRAHLEKGVPQSVQDLKSDVSCLSLLVSFNQTFEGFRAHLKKDIPQPMQDLEADVSSSLSANYLWK